MASPISEIRTKKKKLIRVWSFWYWYHDERCIYIKHNIACYVSCECFFIVWRVIWPNWNFMKPWRLHLIFTILNWADTCLCSFNQAPCLKCSNGGVSDVAFCPGRSMAVSTSHCGNFKVSMVMTDSLRISLHTCWQDGSGLNNETYIYYH